MKLSNNQHISTYAIPRKSSFILAPMAGFTDSAFRKICMNKGAAFCYTELIVAEGFSRAIPATMLYARTERAEQPIGCHLYGNNPESLSKAAAYAEELGVYALVDLNAGCPVRKLTAKGSGAALIRDPQKLYTMVKAMKDATRLPVTVKTRIGLHPSSMNICETASAVEDAGADAITVHARFASDFHKGDADWNILKKLSSTLHIPLIGNGGATDAQSAVRMLQETGVHAVMIGRAALGNPWIFEEIKCIQEGIPYVPPTHYERSELIIRHLHEHIHTAELEKNVRPGIKLSAETAGCRTFLAHLLRYFNGIPGARKKCTSQPLDTVKAIESVIRSISFL